MPWTHYCELQAPPAHSSRIFASLIILIHIARSRFLIPYSRNATPPRSPSAHHRAPSDLSAEEWCWVLLRRAESCNHRQLRADHPRGAGAIVNDQGLTEILGHLRLNRARRDVYAAARWPWNYQSNWPDRVILCTRRQCEDSGHTAEACRQRGPEHCGHFGGPMLCPLHCGKHNVFAAVVGHRLN